MCEKGANLTGQIRAQHSGFVVGGDHGEAIASGLFDPGGGERDSNTGLDLDAHSFDGALRFHERPAKANVSSWNF